MCGVAGVLCRNRNSDLAAAIDAMTESLSHRGPDDRGIFVSETAGVALGMRRLSITDLVGGRQPMSAQGGMIQVVYNGEIYNHVAIRDELRRRGHEFTTDHSDTEVVLRGFLEWGPCLFPRLNGMFAVIIWDALRSRLVVARDRLGKKPLYIGQIPGGFVVGSELKSLLQHPDFVPEVDLGSIAQYLAYDYIVAPRTILKGVVQLEAGAWATIDAESITRHSYWEPDLALRGSEVGRDPVRELDLRIDGAVGRRAVADVPVGLFLSGGLDSATIGYYLRRHQPEVNSFSIGFDDPRFDESDAATVTAKALGCRHHTLRISSRDVIRLVEQVPDVLDEPMGDPSIIPTMLLSELASQRVKVALGGDGSDELFLGYKSHRALRLGWEIDRLPKQLAGAATAVLGRMAGVSRLIHSSAPDFLRRLREPPEQRLLHHLGSYKGQPSSIMTSSAINVADPWRAQIDLGKAPSGHSQTTAAYLRTYLQNDILVKVDRASMATGLEVRSPFLDPSVVAFALQLPQRRKLRGLTGKVILREMMADRLPAGVLERRKMGFGAPMSAWLRTELRELVSDTLAPSAVAESGYLDPGNVARMLNEHLSNRADHGRRLWLLLQLELWRRRWGAGFSEQELEPVMELAV